ncbi:MAG: protein-L-isoaspartate O-methyltransferase family protein [Rhizomicrobium sp.]
MSDYAVQRFNMVETQVRPNDVTDPRIHAAMNAVARERFVPTAKRAIAYADLPVEVAQGRYLPDPRTFAKLLQLAAIHATDNVLDVACATGYSTVVIARLAKSVTALEQDADLVRIASEMVPTSGASNATVVQGGLTEGCKQKAPYDVIFINGAVETVPDSLLNQLAEGGRLVAIVRDGMQGRAQIFVREKGRLGSREDFDSGTPLLAGFRKVVGFVF